MSGPREVPMGTKQKYTPSDPGQKGGEGFSGGSNAFPGKDPAEDHQYGHDGDKSSFQKPVSWPYTSEGVDPPPRQGPAPGNNGSSQPTSPRAAANRDKLEGTRHGGVNPNAPQNTKPFEPSKEKHDSGKKKDEKKNKD
ncbi:hypothetical protein PV05_07289 [Exophiala xenobiotica]|uniref:Uncharacterized protein n=1 Tax=Exophiala xenobiotica TaxID=348802 RepID=A0A0D2F532_9EURO|nr:uncharacterized protein PV05_07289 [Exophiala xenobiotica]KIW54969.1 hypothetical protein PV05_07289 [Exophiala xenobiotica]